MFSLCELTLKGVTVLIPLCGKRLISELEHSKTYTTNNSEAIKSALNLPAFVR